MKIRRYIVLLLLIQLYSHAQVNGYAKVTGISGNVLTLSNANQTFDSFVAGEYVLVIQMQGADITGFTSNASSFGTLNSLNSAGLYEIGIISAVNGAVTSLTLANNLSNSYSTSGGLQIVTFPKLGTTNYTTTADIGGVSWDGNVGGVIAFYVNGNLNLFHNINANGLGFRGGSKAQNDGSTCENSTWRTSSGNTKYSDKGEGVYITASTEKAGRAKAVNGGGGGIVHNGGGGGGGNYTVGGIGYYGYPGDGCDAGFRAGGHGGLPISSSYFRVFLGGGGGGGQGNNSQASDGSRGGGLILIKCDTVVVSGACSAVSISANGVDAVNSGQDGAGGGGAGGTMVFQVKGFRVKSGCPLTVTADGGDGGDVIHVDTHGAGGGGGQGAIYVNSTATVANATFQTDVGAGGFIDDSRTTQTESGGGTPNSGVFPAAFSSPLPIELTEFAGEETEPKVVELHWRTASELNNDVFEIYHSTNGGNWKLLGKTKGAGTCKSPTNYRFTHNEPFYGVNYYRLKQIDYDGRSNFSPLIYVNIEETKLNVKIYPNPTNGDLSIESDEDLSAENFFVLNSFGEKINTEIFKLDNLRYKVSLSGLEPGIYFLYSQSVREKIILIR